MPWIYRLLLEKQVGTFPEKSQISPVFIRPVKISQHIEQKVSPVKPDAHDNQKLSHSVSVPFLLHQHQVVSLWSNRVKYISDCYNKDEQENLTVDNNTGAGLSSWYNSVKVE